MRNRTDEIEDKTRDHARHFDAVALWRVSTSDDARGLIDRDDSMLQSK